MHRQLKIVSLVLFLLLAQLGCAGLTTREDLRQRDRERPPGVGEVSDPKDSKAEGQIPGPGISDPLEEPLQPSPPAPVQMPKVGVIFGPGGFKSFAQAGVLKELERARIPIEAVVGLEWGALVAALYAQNGQIHEVEWKLYRMEQSDLPQRGGLLRRRNDSLETLGPFLSRQFQGPNSSIERAKIHFACPSLSLQRAGLRWQTRGGFKEALERCLPFPPLFRAQQPSWSAAAFALREAVEHLRQQGVNLVILINVLSPGELVGAESLREDWASAILWQELRRSLAEAQSLEGVHEVIEVNTGAFPIQDFANRRQLVSAGERAGRAAARRIADKYGF